MSKTFPTVAEPCRGPRAAHAAGTHTALRLQPQPFDLRFDVPDGDRIAVEEPDHGQEFIDAILVVQASVQEVRHIVLRNVDLLNVVRDPGRELGDYRRASEG